MVEQRSAVFLMNLLQDVNVLRPLIFMARTFDFRVLILVSAKFVGRDTQGSWQAELETLRDEIGAELEYYESDWDAFRHLTGAGIIFAGSESSVPAHAQTHSLFRYAPPGYLKVTLQHGLECVGFRHSKAHDFSYGQSVSFAADILCAWLPSELQTSIARSQRRKIHVTGPTSVLQTFTVPFVPDVNAPGLVCENLHSVRLNATSDLKSEFIGAFKEFCRLLAHEGQEVVLRPHPGGQYVLKNTVSIPPNARVNNAPMYRVDLRRFAYGISAPSSVLVDMLLANIPTAVWRDRDGAVDADNYQGLTSVSTPQEWFDFSREAASHPERFLDLQRRFLESQQMPLDAREVFANFARIFRAARRLTSPTGVAGVPRRRILFVANDRLPTLQACIERPLAPLVRSGEFKTDLLTEPEVKRVARSGQDVDRWIDRTLTGFAPDALLFCRYSGPFGLELVAWARRHGVPIIYHIDDDLLSVPKEFGEHKHAFHNAPNRLAAVRSLLSGSDLVYASTERLRQRLLVYGPSLPIVAGPINCSGRVIRKAAERPAETIGYTGFDHFDDLMMILPAITTLLDRHPALSFELFGTIPIPDELARFGGRVRSIEPVRDYEAFLQRLSERQWDVGICPLTPSEFNLTKSDNKWVEYTSVGTAVIASGNMIYDECCADGCGVLAHNPEEWSSGLERLVNNDSERVGMVARAQRKLETAYGIAKHQHQILDVIELARERAVEGDQATQCKVEENA